jgi:DNA-directed RNA polymerase specialized sigma24 family protein
VKDLYTNQDWSQIIKELTLYAYTRLKFWGLIKSKHVKGLTAKDIALNAIESVLSEKWHWDPSKYDMITYLKFHVVRGMVANLAKDPAVRQSSEAELLEIEVDSEFSQEDEYNSTIVMAQIDAAVKGETLLPELVDYLGKGFKRSDICAKLNIDPGTYDNALRRLRTKIMKLEAKDILTRSK